MKIYSLWKTAIFSLIAIIMLTALIIAVIVIYDIIRAKAYESLAQNAVIKPVKVFQIGFSKCGTVTIADFFNRNGVPAIHHDFGNLATSMLDNARKGKALIAPQYQQYYVFTDMENMFDTPPTNIPVQLFKELDHQYPGSKFILNTRNKADWLRSRAAHPVYKKNVTTLLAENSRMLNISQDAVLALWSSEWDLHHKAVIEYFKDRPNDLLVFNIDNDSPQKIVNFLKDNFVLNPKHYKHKNKSSKIVKDTVEDPVIPQQFFYKTYKLDPVHLGAYAAN